MAQAEARVQAVVADFAKFARSYGEPDVSKPSEIFGMIAEFCRDLLAHHKVHTHTHV